MSHLTKRFRINCIQKITTNGRIKREMLGKRMEQLRYNTTGLFIGCFFYMKSLQTVEVTLGFPHKYPQLLIFRNYENILLIPSYTR